MGHHTVTKSFLMPSAQVREKNPDLDRVCREVERQRSLIAHARQEARLEALEDAAYRIEGKHAKVGHCIRAPGMADAAKLIRNMHFNESADFKGK